MPKGHGLRESELEVAQDSSQLWLPQLQLAWQKLPWRPSAQSYGRRAQRTRGAARF